MEMSLDKLSEQQVALYDTELVDERGMEVIWAAIDRHFPDGRFSFLDVGGAVLHPRYSWTDTDRRIAAIVRTRF